jgi:L-rhamnonate dehydratase
VFGGLFLDEPVPVNGKLTVSDEPGFGLKLNPDAKLRRFDVNAM